MNKKKAYPKYDAKEYNKFPIINPIQDIIIGFFVDFLKKKVS